MSEKLTSETKQIMDERFGKDSLIAVATVSGGVPYVRSVNAYYEDGCFYCVTYALSNKMILSISLDTFSTQNPKLLWNQLSEMEQISMERSGMDICSISGVARSGG